MMELFIGIAIGAALAWLLFGISYRDDRKRTNNLAASLRDVKYDLDKTRFTTSIGGKDLKIAIERMADVPTTDEGHAARICKLTRALDKAIRDAASAGVTARVTTDAMSILYAQRRANSDGPTPRIIVDSIQRTTELTPKECA